MKKMNQFIATGIVVCASATLSLAHQGATGIVLERMTMMVELGKSVKVIASQVKADTIDTDALSAILPSFQAHSGDALVGFFPEGSNSNASKASDAIWSDSEGFAAISAELAEYSADLETYLADFNTLDETTQKSALTAILKDISSTCKSCHADYRQPE